MKILNKVPYKVGDVVVQCNEETGEPCDAVRYLVHKLHYKYGEIRAVISTLSSNRLLDRDGYPANWFTKAVK